MPRYIIKLADKYLEWSTVVDAPVTNGMTLEEFKQFYIDQYGQSKAQELEERLERVERTGTSTRSGETLDELISFNRAGPNEFCLTKEEIIKEYCK